MAQKGCLPARFGPPGGRRKPLPAAVAYSMRFQYTNALIPA
ncbi:hypothetical protein B0G77_0682 [Paraburkholderia sp. BL10I2N1]|nr:hypothetical protein B0G77_0682 [Paraburkholderia sp. BL10I2N1]